MATPVQPEVTATQVFESSDSILAGSYVQDKYNESKNARDSFESRWTDYFNQFRGRYSHEEQVMLTRIREKNPYASEAFIKITKTKALAAYGSIIEVLTAGNEFPISVEETTEPEGIAKKIHLDQENTSETASTIEELASSIGYAGDGRAQLPPGTSTTGVLGGLGSKLSNLFKGGSFAQGEAPTPDVPEISPAKIASDRMNEVLQSQLMENEVVSEIEKCVWEMCVLGTGIIKGPFTKKELIPHWTYEEGSDKPVFSPIEKILPVFKAPSIWSIFPDPYATSITNCDYIVERHKMTKAQLSKLKTQPGFNADVITVALRQNANALEEFWETNLRDNDDVGPNTRYEVLELWGKVTVGEAKQFGIEGIPKNLDDSEYVDVQIWAVHGMAIRKELNPFIPERLPYFIIPYEVQPYQLWGQGIPENMEDAQRMINVHTRAAQDNLRLAGSVMLEVNEAQLVPGQDNTIYAGKIWRRQGGAPGQSIYSINVNNTAANHFQMIQQANQMADQTTVPSVLHGQTGVTGVGRTATSLSMIMNGGNLAIRTVIKNLDRDLLKPLGNALFQWNMQFNMDTPEIRGDLRIIAKGASALSQREVQSQRLLTFIQIMSNPALAPYANLQYLIKELARSLEINPNEAVNDVDMIKTFLSIQGANNGNPQATGVPAEGQPNPQGPGGPQGAAPPPPQGNPGGSTGGDIGLPIGPGQG